MYFFVNTINILGPVFTLFVLILGNFWCCIVTSLETLKIILNNPRKNIKCSQQIKNNKNPNKINKSKKRVEKNAKKSKKIHKLPKNSKKNQKYQKSKNIKQSFFSLKILKFLKIFLLPKKISSSLFQPNPEKLNLEKMQDFKKNHFFFSQI